MNQTANLKKSMNLFDLVLFNIVAVVGLRWTAMAAGAGPSSLILWLIALFIFFIPSALVVIELTARYPKEGGIYVWTKSAFGEFHSFVPSFFYWVNNLVYFPNLLMFEAGIFLYIFGSQWLHLEKSGLYTGTFSLVVLWIAVIVNMVGVKTGKWLQNIGAMGSWLPAIILAIIGVIAWQKFGCANTFAGNLIPTFSALPTITVFANLCFGFAGMELQSCMSEEIENPTRNIPRAVFISGIIIALIYIISTTALLVALPSKDISIISGVVQVISKVAEKVNMLWIGPMVALFMTLGGLGGIGAWLSGTARIPFVIGIDRYLPPWLAEVHPKWGTPANAILAQGIVCSFLIIMSAIGSSVKESYLILVDATLILYFIPYLYIFLAFIKLKKKGEKDPKIFATNQKVSMKKVEVVAKSEEMGDIVEPEQVSSKFNFPPFLGYIGALTTILAIIMALIPSAEIKNVALFEIKVIGGVLVFFGLACVMFYSARKKMNEQIKLGKND